MAKLSSLKNIGKQTESWLNEVGIYTPEDLDDIGIVEAWARVKERVPQASLVGLYALQGALMDIHWNHIPQDIKDDIVADFEARVEQGR